MSAGTPLMIGAAVAFGLAAVITVAAAIALLLIELGVEPWLSAVITAALMGRDRVRARAVRHVGAAQEDASHRSKPCIPSRRRPSG